MNPRKRNSDPGHSYADAKIEAVLKSSEDGYKAAEAAIRRKATKYLRKHKKAIQEQRELVEQGIITRQQFELWCHANVFGAEWVELCDQMAQELTNANKLAVAGITDSMSEVYAENFNYGTYQVESAL